MADNELTDDQQTVAIAEPAPTPEQLEELLQESEDTSVADPPPDDPPPAE
ncbi:MAG: hypothetical protein AB7R89_18265 [Dehalococcoidia bacterium]